MKKRTVRTLSLMLTVVLMLTMLTGCGEKNKVKDLISDFESACRIMDMNAILDCLDPQVVAPMRGVASLFGVGGETVTGLVYSVIGLGWLAGAAEDVNALTSFMASIRIEPTDYAFNSDKTVCDVTVTYSREINGQEQSEEGTFRCILYNGDWYIAVI